MTLSFITKWPAHMGVLANKPNYFVEKILASVEVPVSVMPRQQYAFSPLAYESCKPKRHTIRAGNRWRKGMRIHPVINNRTKNRFQFAPTTVCTGVQEIEIKWMPRKENTVGAIYCGYTGKVGFEAIVIVNKHNMLRLSTIETLAINDGFESIDDFFAYFNKPFKGQIIHWTDLRY